MKNSFDWLDLVEENFQNQQHLATLRQDKFYGSIEIHFEAGVPKTINYKEHLKAYSINEYNPNKGG